MTGSDCHEMIGELLSDKLLGSIETFEVHGDEFYLTDNSPRLIVLSIFPLITVSTLNVLIYFAIVKSGQNNEDETRYELPPSGDL